MFFGRDLDNPNDVVTRNRTRHAMKTGYAFGPTNMDPPNPGRRRKGKTAGGWDGGSLW